VPRSTTIVMSRAISHLAQPTVFAVAEAAREFAVG
jgi:hypothetical protein